MLVETNFMIGGMNEENCVLFLGMCLFCIRWDLRCTADFTNCSFSIACCILFCESSERMHAWFRKTKLYKENLEDYVAGNGMRKQAKIRIMCTVTVLMSIGFILMSSKGVYIGCIVLACVWILHILYFRFKVKTIAE